jgi:hypothetical protein
MAKICIFGAHHEFQEDSPIDCALDRKLRELAKDHKADMMF